MILLGVSLVYVFFGVIFFFCVRGAKPDPYDSAALPN